MLLTITTARAPATDLGYLLHKHPGRVQSFDVASGTAHVFYPEAAGERCTAALLLEVDPVALVRGTGDSVTHYVNDRPYAASSLLAVALKRVFSTALAGRCEARPELAATPIPLEIRVPALRCSGGPELAGRVFGPLGWEVSAEAVPLDPPSWGTSAYLDLRLTGTVRLARRRAPRCPPRCRCSRPRRGAASTWPRCLTGPRRGGATPPRSAPPTSGTAGRSTAWRGCAWRRSRCSPPKGHRTRRGRTPGTYRWRRGSWPPTRS